MFDVSYGNNTRLCINGTSSLAEFSFLLENIISWYMSQGINVLHIKKTDKVIDFTGEDGKPLCFSPVTKLSFLIDQKYLELKPQTIWTLEESDNFIYKNLNVSLSKAETLITINEAYDAEDAIAHFAYGLADLLTVLLCQCNTIRYQASANVSQLIFNKIFTRDSLMKFVDREEDYNLSSTTEELCHLT